MKKIIALLMVLALVMSLTLVGCGLTDKIKEEVKDTISKVEKGSSKIEADATGKTLEDTIDKATLESIQKQARESFKDSQFSCEFTIEGNNAIYTYTYDETYSDEQVKVMKDSFDSSEASLKEQGTKIIDAYEKQYGLNGVIVSFLYVNGDGTLIRRFDIAKE